MGRNDGVKIYVDEVKVVTAKAALCDIDGDEVWLPLSQCWDGGAENWSPAKGDTDIELEIPAWLVDEKGL